MIISATSPPVQLSAVASVAFASRRAAPTTSSMEAPSENTCAPRRCFTSSEAASSLACAASRSAPFTVSLTWISGKCARNPSFTPGKRSSRPVRIRSTPDSGSPKQRYTRTSKTSGSGRSFARRGTTCSANICFISRGTPGMKKNQARPIFTAKPGAVPIGFGSTSLASGISACLRLFSGIVRPRAFQRPSM